jgi:hypothetical protein
MKKCIAGVFVALALSLVSQFASAHVLVMDDSRTHGAIVHIMPDDDPVAGEEAIIYFDRQGVKSAKSILVELTIYDEQNRASRVVTETKDALTTARFTFPKQGVYELQFIVKDTNGELVFSQSQRVTRGVASANDSVQSYAWAESLFVTCSVVLLVLSIIFFNRRREIKNYSRF